MTAARTQARCETAAVFNHEPSHDRCPFCAFVRSEWADDNASTDLVAQEELAFARMAPKWWPDNPGSALVIPMGHDENVYDLPVDVGHAVWDLTRRVAVAMRETFDCEGVSTRQHNEPAGDQDVWHPHVHAGTRHQGDELYHRHEDAGFAAPKARVLWAALLCDRLLSAEPAA